MRSECGDSADTGHSTDATTEDTAGESTDLEEESVYNGNMDSPSSQEGSGIETFVCRDQSTGIDLGTTVVNLPQVGDNDIVTCEVTPTQVGDLQLAIIALNGTVPSKTSVWTVAALTEDQIDPNEANRTLGFVLLIVLGLLGILLAE